MLRKHFWSALAIFAILFCVTYALEFEDDDEDNITLNSPLNIDDEKVPVPMPTLTRIVRSSINCQLFSDYALNCTMNAALIYNSYKKSPPLPSKVGEWCSAIKYLTNCAKIWNEECRQITDSHFNEESINGHSYVVNNICDDNMFIRNYQNMTECVEKVTSDWEQCYTSFKGLVDGFKKNTTTEWTHFETHFYLCCGRAKFRRCIIDLLYANERDCHTPHAMTLQKFSVIVSEGDVYQNCDFNMDYSKCPGGDPRPQIGDKVVANLLALSPEFSQNRRGSGVIGLPSDLLVSFLMIINTLL